MDCSFANQAAVGTWHWASRSFTPRDCTLRSPLRASRVRQCLRNKTITFVGDSLLRELALAFAGLLHTLDADATDDTWSLHAGSQLLYHGATPDNHTYRTASGQTHLPCFCVPHVKKQLFGSSPVRNTQGTRGVWTHPTLHATVRSFADAQRAIHWPSIRSIVRKQQPHEGGARAGSGGSASAPARAAPARDPRSEVVFVGLGIHDTNPQISESLKDGGARWKAEPLSWIHGPVFQPYLDHWCEASDQTVGDDVPWPPLMWVTPYRQCREKKPRKWRYQTSVMAAASEATLAASEREGVPVLDLSRLTTTTSTTTGVVQAGSSSSSTDGCSPATDDGVHVHKWADHVVASLLLTYLCDRDGRFHQPYVRTGLISRRCRERQGQRERQRSATQRAE